MAAEESTHNTGKKGEEIALAFLVKNGYKPLQENWRFGKYEVDLIVENGEYLVFVEVKFRNSDFFGDPEIFVTAKQKQNLVKAANRYIDKFGIEKEVRFDIVSIVMKGNKPLVKHIKGAFSPEVNKF